MIGRRTWMGHIGALLALAALGATSGCHKSSEDADTVTVGAFLSLSGGQSTFGGDTREGIELAADEVNASGGVKGKKVRVLYEDDKSNPQEASNKVRELIDRDKVVAVLGEVASSRSLAGGLVANTKHVPMITPSSTAVEVTQGRDYVFRACFTDDMQGRAGAEFAVKTLGKKKVAILFVAQDAYSSGLAASFREAVKKLGADIVADKGYQMGETNFTTYLSEIKAANPEIVYVPNYYTDMVPIARQAHALGMPGSMFLGGDGWDSEELTKGAAAELEGAYFTNHYAPDVPWPNSQAFVKSYRAKYHRDPSSLTAQGFDAARLLFDAMNRAPALTPEAIKTAIASTKGFQGATGTITIDASHNAQKPLVVVQVKAGKFTYHSTVGGSAESASAKP
jgi:branched-chain amino acid transport system substrate-binding protein